MENLVLTQLTILELKDVFREVMQDFFNSAATPNNFTGDGDGEDEIGGIELAEKITGLKKQTIYGLVSERKIPHSKRGKRLYFSRKDLLDWIKKGKRKTGIEIAEMMDKFDSKR